jgi:hypothetical protein
MARADCQSTQTCACIYRMFMRLFGWGHSVSVRLHMPSGGSINVALIDDEHAIRKGLGLLIDGTPGYRCAGAFGSVEEALRSLGGQTPDVLLLDINLPGIPGSEGARLLSEKFPPSRWPPASPAPSRSPSLPRPRENAAA